MGAYASNSELIDKCSAIFDGMLGKPSKLIFLIVVPKALAPTSLAIAFQSEVETELGKLLHRGIIKKVGDQQIELANT